METTPTPPTTSAPPTSPTTPQAEMSVEERVAELVYRAEHGDFSTVPELRAVLTANPHMWKRSGNLDAQTIAAWQKLTCGNDLMLRESTSKQMEDMRQELSGSDPDRIERLLVARIVACWLQVNYADAHYAGLKEASATQQTMALQRQDSAQRRYLRALKELAKMRKLLRPPVSPLDWLRQPVAETPAAKAGSVNDRLKIKKELVLN
jgi:hypothetical protein